MINNNSDFDQGQIPNPPPQSGNPILNPSVFLQFAGAALPEDIKQIDPNNIRNQVEKGQAMIPPYFDVTRKSVLHRLKNLICPFAVKQWSRSVSDGKKCIPVNNPNAPELYTPIVFSFFYFLMSSLISGIRNEFSMDNLYLLVLKFSLVVTAEVLLFKFLFSYLGIIGTYPLLSLVADFSCISFYLSITSLFSWNRVLYWISTIYCALSAMIWTLRTLKSEQCIAGRQTSSSQFITYLLFFISIFQAVLVFFNTPRTYAINFVANNVQNLETINGTV